MDNDFLPTLFFGHGSPMKAVEDNEFTRFLKNAAQGWQKPKAILVISAHWETPKGSHVLSHPKPRTIHDFGGFPETLYRIQYPAPGEVKLASLLAQSAHIDTDASWGLDHGAWSVLLHLYPQADIPVVQLSLDRSLTPAQHYELAKSLCEIRKKGVLIIGSGNITHNPRDLDWKNSGAVMSWAREFDEAMKTAILKRDLPVVFAQKGIEQSLWKRAHPSLEHYLPLLYVLGASHETEKVEFLFEGFQMGSLSMRSLRIG